MNSDMELRIDPKNYDTITAKFVSEYGYVGPCCMETIKQHLDDQPLLRVSLAWKNHDNVFERESVYAGFVKHFVDSPEKLDNVSSGKILF